MKSVLSVFSVANTLPSFEPQRRKDSCHGKHGEHGLHGHPQMPLDSLDKECAARGFFFAHFIFACFWLRLIWFAAEDL